MRFPQQMTDDERIAMALAAAKGKFPDQIQDNMISQTAGDPADLARRASKSTKGLESNIAAQQAMANQLRGTGMPKGRQAGDIYTAANPLEFLGAAVNQGMGSYMSKALRKDRDELDVAQEDVNLAGLGMEERIRQGGYAHDFAKQDRTFGQQNLGREDTQEEARARQLAGFEQADATQQAGFGNDYTTQLREFAQDDKQKGLTRAAAAVTQGDRLLEDAAMREERLSKRTPASFMDANEKVHNYFVATGEGKGYEDEDGNRVSVEGMRPFTNPLTGTVRPPRAKTKAEMDREDKRNEDPAGNYLGVTRILDSPLLESSAGYNPDALLASLGWGSDDKGPARQDLQRDMGTVMIEGFAKNVDQLKLTPVSDKEGVVLREDVPDSKTQPYGWVGYTVNTLRPMLDRKFDEAIAIGNQTPEMKAQVLDQLDRSAVRRALDGTTNYPEKDLLRAGIAQETIDSVKAEERAKKAADRERMAALDDEIAAVKARLAAGGK